MHAPLLGPQLLQGLCLKSQARGTPWGPSQTPSLDLCYP